jgi:hypothetical protein
MKSHLRKSGAVSGTAEQQENTGGGHAIAACFLYF